MGRLKPWYKYLFITASNFWGRLEPSHQTILSWVFVKYFYSWKPCCNYVFHIFPLIYISKKEKNEYDFHRVVNCFYKFWLSLVPRKVLIYCRQSVSLLFSIVSRYGQNFRQNQDPLWRASRGNIEPNQTSTMEVFARIVKSH